MKNETICVRKTLFLYFLFSKSISIRNFTLTCQKNICIFVHSFNTFITTQRLYICTFAFFSYNFLIFCLFNTNWESTLWVLNVESSLKVYFNFNNYTDYFIAKNIPFIDLLMFVSVSTSDMFRMIYLTLHKYTS